MTSPHPDEAVVGAMALAPRALPAPGRRYWHAQAFADTVLAEFNAARTAHDLVATREHFYVLAAYYRRTLAILHGALEQRREALAVAAMENLVVLQRSLSAMRESSPNTALSTLALETDLRRRVNEDLVYRILRDAGRPLGVAAIVRRFNDLDVIAQARLPAIEAALLTLVQTGHVIEHNLRYRPTGLPYVDANVDRMELSMLLGPILAHRLSDAGFEGISSLLEQRDAFQHQFRDMTGFSEATSVLAVACVEAMDESSAAIHGADRWPHRELASSAHPRPYQRLLHAILRAHRYAGQVIEAPAGCGKTFVGMLCIEDWLRTMAPGQSILVVVPTANYQRQWFGELCLKPAGLGLAPHHVFTGTPRASMAHRRNDIAPVVLVMTYASLARLGSGGGSVEFDGDAIERFLQGNDVRHVILDEVHKVTADLSSATAEMTRVILRWLDDGSVRSVIGFSGTVLAYQRQIRALGLSLASVLPTGELVAQGWVAPFAEYGVPFSYSERERRILASISDFRALLRSRLKSLDPVRLRAAFAAIPMAERMRIATMLGMYAGRRDASPRIESRLGQWESGLDLRLNEALLVSIVQIVHGWPDYKLQQHMGRSTAASVSTADFERVRAALRDLLPPGRARRRLSSEGFGETLDTGGLAAHNVRDALATTAIGGYLATREWSRQAGEGRVAIVRAIIEAERDERAVSGVIVFDTAGQLDWRDRTATPGYRGAAGLFAEMAADRSCVAIAALGSELYLPDNGDDALHARIGAWILQRFVTEEQGMALFELIVAGAALGEEQRALLRPAFEQVFGRYIAGVNDGQAASAAEFELKVFHPLREFAHAHHLTTRNSLLAWLSAGGHHVRASVAAILDYVAIARLFRTAPAVAVACGDGAIRPIRAVSAGRGRRRQQLLDLTARLVDAEDLPVEVVIVSSWARTGWNVLTPNVLIDATATRNVTAWQQLRGRAMRPRPGWSSDAQRLVQRLIAADRPDSDEEGTVRLDSLPPEEARILADASGARIPVRGSSSKDREALATAVMLRENKVTHVYELVNARGDRGQLEHRRGSGWERIQAVAAKHNHEDAVRASDGMLIHGPAHAPLIVAEDPRYDTPAQVRQRLAIELNGADERIVSGWLRASAHREASDPQRSLLG